MVQYEYNCSSSDVLCLPSKAAPAQSPSYQVPSILHYNNVLKETADATCVTQGIFPSCNRAFNSPGTFFLFLMLLDFFVATVTDPYITRHNQNYNKAIPFDSRSSSLLFSSISSQFHPFLPFQAILASYSC